MFSNSRTVYELLDNLSLAAKVIGANSRHVGFILKQLADPKNYRPLKTLSETHDRELSYNPKTGIWNLRKVKNRFHHSLRESYSYYSGCSSSSASSFGHPKETPFTKKTSVTLLPPHAKINFYDPKGWTPVGLLINLSLCHLKDEKYIFPRMANTDKRWWLNRPGKNHEVMRSIPLETLRQILREACRDDKRLDPNELLVGLSKEALVGVFALSDSRDMRLLALVTQQKIECVLQMKLPIFIIDQHGIKEYTLRSQREDLFELSIMNAKLYQQYLVEFNLSLQKSLEEKSYPTFKFELLYKNAIEPIFRFLTAAELASFAQVNKKYYFMLNDENLKYLWVNATRRTIQVAPGANKYDIQILAQQNKNPSLSLEKLARRNYDNAYAIMHSKNIKNSLPAAQQELTLAPRNRTTRLFHGSAGLFLGLAIGVVATLIQALYSLFEILLRMIACNFVEYTMNSCVHTSILRRALGVTCFPIYSILKSAYFGACYGWQYGLSPLSTLSEGIFKFHSELYNGRSSNDDAAYDPWHCCPQGENIYTDNTRTNIHQFFKDRYFKTVADIAKHVEKRKPQLQFFKSHTPNGSLKLETSALTTVQQRKIT